MSECAICGKKLKIDVPDVDVFCWECCSKIRGKAVVVEICEMQGG